MKKILLNILAGVLITTVFTTCGSGSCRITMTAESDGVITFLLAGSGVVTVDWGDGSEKVRLTLNENGVEFVHKYSVASIRTITIIGDNIVELDCSGIGLTNLDVRRATALKWLDCSDNQLTDLNVSRNTALRLLNCSNNRLTNLDVSKNTALKALNISENKFSANALSALFHSLHSNDIGYDTGIYGRTKGIRVDEITASDRNMIEHKGWTVFFW